jgi:starch phosphorylase
VKCQRDVAKAFTKQDQWNKIALRNVARCGKFSSDRTIHQYAEDIWDVEPVKVKLP